MANITLYQLLVADSSGEGKHLVISNQQGKLVTSVYENPTSLSQTDKLSVVNSVSNSVFYPTKSKTTVGDTFINPDMVKETGIYLLEYSFLGDVSVFGGDNAVESEAEFTSVIKRYVNYTVSKIVNITSLDALTVESFVDESVSTQIIIGGTTTGFTNTLEANDIVFASADDVSAFTSAKYTMTGTSTVTLTKLS